MISDKIKNFFQGTISVEVTGRLLSPLLNQLNRSGIYLWDVRKTSDETIQFTLNLRDFRYFRACLKKTNCKFTIKHKSGIPFFNWRLRKRYMFVAGFLFFLLFIWTMTGFIWDIEVRDQHGKQLTYEAETVIREQLVEIGVAEGTWKRNIPDKDMIQSQLREQLQNEYVWIGTEVQGTKLKITAVPIAKAKTDEKSVPSNLVARKQAMIHRILVYEGVAYVKPGQKVSANQILISGSLYEDEQGGKKIAAEGVVEGIVWYTVEVALPLQREVETYTGNSVKKHRLVWKQWDVPLYLRKSLAELVDHDMTTVVKQAEWGTMRFPVELHVDTYFEKEKEVVHLDREAAKDIALESARQRVKGQKDFKEVVSETIIEYNIDEQQAYLKVLIETIEDITVRKVI